MSTIVIIDDDSTTTALIKTLLEIEGYQVMASNTIASAMAETHGDVGALVIDCYLANDESGAEFVKEIRQGKTGFRSDVPAILVSGDQRQEAEAARVGANLFMLKPYSPNELSAKLRMLLAAPG